MQSLTVAHTWHYHRARATTGHVWQGRFKSPVIGIDAHLLTVMRYVESNPLRAGMVADLAEYPWFSYLLHGLGKLTGLVDEAPVWASLAKTEPQRKAYWREWLQTPLTAGELQAVRRAITSGRPYGASGWTEGMAQQLGISLSPRRRGRPRSANKI